MKVAVTGATGNVGSALVRALAADDRVARIVGIARRVPEWTPPRTTWVARDVTADDLVPAFSGADVVVHLAWAIQPSRDPAALWRTNVVGSERMIAATEAAGVPALVHASSVGVYSPGPKDRAVHEDHPRRGTTSSDYARHKAAVEDRLDALERRAPSLRVARMRPGLCFSRDAATGVRRLFAGERLPRALLRPSRIPVVPDIPGLRFQAVHSDDVADAYLRAALDGGRGAYNVAAEPVLDVQTLTAILGARRIPFSARLARAALSAGWRARLVPIGPGWLDMALSVPVMDSSRARDDLGWAPRYDSGDALRELLEGMADGAGAPTPPLSPAGGPMESGK